MFVIVCNCLQSFVAVCTHISHISKISAMNSSVRIHVRKCQSVCQTISIIRVFTYLCKLCVITNVEDFLGFGIFSLHLLPAH